MRMLDYQLTDMSAEGKAALPKILDEMGYTGRYVISDFGISINSNATVLSRAVKKSGGNCTQRVWPSGMHQANHLFQSLDPGIGSSHTEGCISESDRYGV